MSLHSDIVQYKVCIKCKRGLTRLTDNYCRYCRPRKSSNKSVLDIKHKFFSHKFEDKSKSKSVDISKGLFNCSSSKSEQTIYISNIQLSNNLVFFDNTITQQFSDLNFCLKFNNFDDFTNFILKSGRVSFSYLLMTGSTKLQKLPKFKKLIQNKIEGLISRNNLIIQKLPPTPYTTPPLQLLSKSSYWENLLKVFFNLFHPLSPVLSIKSFVLETAPQSLLSAMYYCGYKYQPDQPEEVTSYMSNYAEKNIKQLMKGCSLSNAQALAIYSVIYHLEGNIQLAQACQSQATRISYALGIQLDHKLFSPSARYNRKVLFSKIRSTNIAFSGFHNLSPSYLTEYGKLDSSFLLSKWQKPSQNFIFNFTDETESFVYSECCTQLIKFNDLYNYNIWNSNINNARDSCFKSEWNRSQKVISKTFLEYIRTFQSLTSKYPKFKEKILIYEIHLTMFYHQFMIELYSVLKTKLGELNQSEITKTLYHCDSLLSFTSSRGGSLDYSPVTQFFIYFVAFHYLNFYPTCNLNDRELIKSKLKVIIESIPETSNNIQLNYLVLKNGYKSIANNNQ